MRILINLVTFPKIYPNLFLELILWIFLKIQTARTSFCSVSTFTRPGVTFCVYRLLNNEYILDNISRT